MVLLPSDLRSVTQITATFCNLNPIRPHSRPDPRLSFRSPPSAKLSSLHALNAVERTADMPFTCTADELHHVSVHNSDWSLALWRYKPSPKAPPRNHPLLLLSGVGTNAVGYDLDPGSSFARSMSSQGFDTWILEVRGAGLSPEVRSREAKQPVNIISEQINSAIRNRTDGAYSAEQLSDINSDTFADYKISSAKGRTEMAVKSAEPQLVTKFMETFTHLSERISDLLNEGLVERRQNSALAGQIRDLSQRLVNLIEEGQRSVSPQFIDILGNFLMKVEDFQKQVDLIVKYNWDFDHYLEEDVPAAMAYIQRQCKPKDGKLLAIGHSMGGMLLYAMLSRNGCKGKDSELASVITLGSSLDFTTSKSSLKFLLALKDPAQTLNVPAVPLGALLAAAYPLACHPPYIMSWLNPQISAQDMMHPDLFEKLVLNNFCTVPTRLLLQLSTALHEGGLCDRSGTFFYKDHLCKSDVPVLALAGDQDLICPPEAVYETVKLIPRHLATYKVFGGPGGPHYAHYDLVGGRFAADQLYPFIIEYLNRHDLN